VLAIGTGTTAEVNDRNGGTHPWPDAGAATVGQAMTHGLSAEALAHADRVAHAARTLLHHDSSDDEPPADTLLVNTTVESVPIKGTKSEAAVTETALSHKSDERAGADAAVANPSQPALTHADRRHDVARLPDGMQPEARSPTAGLPAPDSLRNGVSVCHGHIGAEAEAIATHPEAMELTLKLSSSSEGPAATDRAPGSANAAAIAGGFGSTMGLTAPASQPPLTLLLTPASSPTQSSAELGASAAAGAAPGQPLTLVLSPGSSREQGSRDQPVGATASGADAGSAGALQLALSSSSGQAQQARSANNGEHVNAQLSAPSMSSGAAAEQQSSQPLDSSVNCSAPRSEAALSASAQHSAGQQSATPGQAAQAAPSDDGARGPISSAGTPGAAIPTPSTVINADGPASAAPTHNKTPEESPLHLAQRTPGLAPLSRVPPTPHTGAALRAALAPEVTPGGSSRVRDFAGGNPAARPAKRRMSSLLARASSDRAGTPQDGGIHAAPAQQSRPTAAGGARRWGYQGDLPTLAEAMDGPGTVRLRNPPPTQVCRILCKYCEPHIVQGMLSEPLLIGAAAQQGRAPEQAKPAQQLCC